MRHFHRTSVGPAAVIEQADRFFPTLGLTATTGEDGARRFSGQLGTRTFRVRKEGEHYPFVEVDTDKIGESRLDKNVKRFFVSLHRMADPSHAPTAGY